MGTTAIDTGQGGSATGTPPAGSGGSPGNDGGTGTPSGATGDPGFDRGALNPVLRDMSPTQINELFSNLLTATRSPAPTAAPSRAPEPSVPSYTPEQIRDFFDSSKDTFDPAKGVDAIAMKNYGPLLGDINKRAINGLFANFRTKFHDFGDFEADINATLVGRDPASLSEDDIFGTYLTLKGARVLKAEQTEIAKKRAASTVAPSAPKVNEEPTVELSEMQQRVARAMFPKAADPIAAYKSFMRPDDDSGMTLKVPMGTDAKGNLIKE